MHKLAISVLLCPLILTQTGCLYLHNDGDEKTAKAAKDAFDSLTKTSPFSSQTQNLKDFQATRDALEVGLNQSNAQVHVRTLLSNKWESVVGETSDLKDSAAKTLQELANRKAEAEAKLTEEMAVLTGATSKRTSALEALNDAALLKAKWQATQVLIGQTLVEATKKKSTTRPSEAISAALATTMPVAGFEEKDGVLVNKTPTTKPVSEILEFSPIITRGIARIATTQPAATQPFALENLKDLVKDPKSLTDQLHPPSLVFKDPGLAITIASLLFDVANANEKRIEGEIAYWKSEINTYNAYQKYLQERVEVLAQDLDADAGVGIGALAKDRDPNDKTIRETIVRLVNELQASQSDYLRADNDQNRAKALDRRGKAHGRLRLLYPALYANLNNRVIAAATGEHYEDLLASQEVERALRATAINFEEREAFMRRGLEGLLAYHQGGITASDISHVIGIVQAFGIFRIAATN